MKLGNLYWACLFALTACGGSNATAPTSYALGDDSGSPSSHEAATGSSVPNGSPSDIGAHVASGQAVGSSGDAGDHADALSDRESGDSPALANDSGPSPPVLGEDSGTQDVAIPSICYCHEQLVSCGLPCDSGMAPTDASSEPSEASRPAPPVSCEQSFMNEFGIGAAGSTGFNSSLTSCPAGAVDLCAAATNSYQSICAHAGQPSASAMVSVCLSSCASTSWGFASEQAACFFDCWYPVVCGQSAPVQCAPDPGARASPTTQNPPTGTFDCLAQSCYATLAPGAI